MEGGGEEPGVGRRLAGEPGEEIRPFAQELDRRLIAPGRGVEGPALDRRARRLIQLAGAPAGDSGVVEEAVGLVEAPAIGGERRLKASRASHHGHDRLGARGAGLVGRHGSGRFDFPLRAFG